MSEFGAQYAGVYDALYATKDYQGEVELVERLLARHGASGPLRILDLGCGTGNHAIPLSLRGHSVTGVDRSAPMLEQARAKAAVELPASAPKPAFRKDDIRRLSLNARFDAALMMFTVLGYQHENADLLTVLGIVRGHLEPGGLFIFDVWNGHAVLADRPGERTARASQNGAKITRHTRTRMDTVGQILRVHFDVERTNGGATERWEEEHVVRFFFPQEIDLALRARGFQLLELKRFPDGEGPPDETAWNIIGVAQAC